MALPARFRTFLEAYQKCLDGLIVFASEGKSYAKITKILGNGAYRTLCFVNLETGDIFRPRNEKEPNLNFSRGNINNPDNGQEAVGEDGPPHMHNGKPKGFKHDLIYPRRADRKALGPQPRLPKEAKPKAAHRPERVMSHTGPLISVPPPQAAPEPLLVTIRVLPPRVFTPSRETEDLNHHLEASLPHIFSATPKATDPYDPFDPYQY